MTCAPKTLIALSLLCMSPAMGDTRGPGSPIQFVEIAGEERRGLDYSRAPSMTDEIWQALKEQTLVPPPGSDEVVPYTFPLIVGTPEKARGAPGVAILDYDGDGDEDVYVTNGPGASNSLFHNLLRETGRPSFVDRGEAAGVGLEAEDSTGVCYGDIDNDGDEDLYVMNRLAEATLFENAGNGTFQDITAAAGLGAGAELGHTSCSFGDIDNDGYLDVTIGNTFDWTSREAIFVEPVAANHHNQLFRNNGDNTFSDVSESSGIRDTTGFVPAVFDGSPTVSWAISMVDYDQDGDVDIVHADDNAAIPFFEDGGVTRGFVHVFENDGTGSFRDAHQLGPGDFMGLGFGDFDCNGEMDIMATNIGDHMFQVLPFPNVLGKYASRWFLQGGDGSFSDPGVGDDIVATPFGWGASTWDYDNDGDTDIVYFGSLAAAAQSATMDNPGALLRNEGCTGRFTRDTFAFASSTQHNIRAIHGSAIGDLNRDGFDDVVSAAATVYVPPIPETPYPFTFGGAFGEIASFFEIFHVSLDTGDPLTTEFTWNGFEHPEGDLSVQLNSASNGNRSAAIRTLGTKGITSGGGVNRDGIGAVVYFTPRHGQRVMRPVSGGASYQSQDSRILTFGMGRRNRGTAEILWPGGVRNRLYDVRRGERVSFPEIPCSFETDEPLHTYFACVHTALREIRSAGVISRRMRARLLVSAVIAFFNP